MRTIVTFYRMAIPEGEPGRPYGSPVYEMNLEGDLSRERAIEEALASLDENDRERAKSMLVEVEYL